MIPFKMYFDALKYIDLPVSILSFFLLTIYIDLAILDYSIHLKSSKKFLIFFFFIAYSFLTPAPLSFEPS